MSDIKNLFEKEAVEKMRSLVDDINICLFCTNLKSDNISTCRPMSAQKVCEQGNLWFFSEVFSEKNREIKEDNKVQLFFSHPGRSSFLVINGEAEIVLDKQKIDELWTPLVKAWFKEGKDDPNISLIKVKPTAAYYWDANGNRMVNFLKMIASAVAGTNLVTSSEGNLSV